MIFFLTHCTLVDSLHHAAHMPTCHLSFEDAVNWYVEIAHSIYMISTGLLFRDYRYIPTRCRIRRWVLVVAAGSFAGPHKMGTVAAG